MNDSLAAVVWLLVTSLMLTAALFCSRRWHTGAGKAQRIVDVVVLFWGCVVGASTLLGALRILSSGRLLSCATAVALATLAACSVTRGRSLAESDTAKIRPPRNRTAKRRHAFWTVVWGLLASLAVAKVVLHGVLTFPDNWDTLAYHLPLVDHWLVEGTLYVPDCAFWYVSGNNELLGLWLVGPFSGDFLIALNNLPAVVLLPASAFQFMRLLGVTRGLSHLSAMAMVLTWPVFRQLVTAENDVATAAMFLAALVYVVRYAFERRMLDAVLASAAIGLLAGTKYYALGYAAVAGTLLVCIPLPKCRIGESLRLALTGLVGVLVFGSYWYIRNAVVTGAPLFPKGFTKETDLWSVMRPESSASTLLGSGRPTVWELHADAVHAAAGVVHWTALLLLPASLIWLVTAPLIPRSLEPCTITLRRWLVLVTVSAILVLVNTPNVVETSPGTMNMLLSQYHPVRFSFCVLGVAVVALTVMLDDIRGSIAAWAAAHPHHRVVRIIRLAVSIAIYTMATLAVAHQFLHQRRERLTWDWLLLASNIFIAGLLLRLLASSRRLLERSIACAIILSAIVTFAYGGWWLGMRWHEEFDEHYDVHFHVEAFTWFSKEELDGERTVVCDYRYYPFLGSRRQRDVCRPLWLADRGEFLSYVQDNSATIVVLRNHDTSSQRRYAHVKAWVDDADAIFSSLYQDHRYTVVRVHRGRLAAEFESANEDGTP